MKNLIHVNLTTIFSTCLALMVSVLMVNIAHATVLTFDITGATDNDVLSPHYGDRVVSTSNGTFNYEMGNGFTRNITVDYGSIGDDMAPSDVSFWSTGYGDLSNVAWGSACS